MKVDPSDRDLINRQIRSMSPWVHSVVEVARSSRGSGDAGVKGMGNLAHFEHKRSLNFYLG